MKEEENNVIEIEIQRVMVSRGEEEEEDELLCYLLCSVNVLFA